MPYDDRLRMAAISQFAAVDRLYSGIQIKQRTAPYGGGASPDDLAEFNAMCLAVVERLTSRSDAYNQLASYELGRYMMDSLELARALHGIAQSLKRDIQEGSLLALTEITTAMGLNDFLDVSVQLLERSRVDSAAAVFASVLEIRLRQLAAKHGVDLRTESDDLDPEWRSLQQINGDLGQVAYGDADRRAVARWLGIHVRVMRGELGRLSRTLLEEFVIELREFISDHPASIS